MNLYKIFIIGMSLLASNIGFSQITERERPKEWSQLVYGARFRDRFLPMKGNVLSSDTWGAKGVIPRFTDNGIEDRIWSYWGGNIKKGEDNKYHLFVCGWLESSAKGHFEWPNSIVFNAISDRPEGPFTLRSLIGKGHNPEVFRLKDGRYVLYVINGRYLSDSINGPWVYGKFSFNSRDRRISDGLSNLTFAQREDGSYLMASRGGEIWISETGLSEYNLIADHSVYPKVEGRFEDPVIWRDHIQYHMIVNDWLGRIAFYLRSKDGINWVVDPGEAYTPGIAFHENGMVENWFKIERCKIYQDQYGRAVQANFAVIDAQKEEDKPGDIHSSKNITIPLNPGLLLTILNPEPITAKTKTIRVKILAEEGFNPQTDIDSKSLRFGSSGEVNYGRGCTVLKTENEGNNLVVTFNGAGNGITEEEFAPKLIGKSVKGNLIFGYARLPYQTYIEPILSARAPVFLTSDKKQQCIVEVQNFGQIASQKASIKIEYSENDKQTEIASGIVPGLKPYEKQAVQLSCNRYLKESVKYKMTVTIYSGKKIISTFNYESTPITPNAHP